MNRPHTIVGSGLLIIDKLGINLDRFIQRIRIFCFNNQGFIDFVFFSIYTLEQLLLLVTIGYATYFTPVEIVSFYILILFLTFSLQKIILISNTKMQEKERNELIKKAHLTTATMCDYCYNKAKLAKDRIKEFY